MDATLCGAALGTNQSSSTLLSSCGRPLEQRASAAMNGPEEVMERFLHMVESSKWERIGGRVC